MSGLVAVVCLAWLLNPVASSRIVLADVIQALERCQTICYSTSLETAAGVQTTSRTLMLARNLVRTEYADGHVFIYDRAGHRSLTLWPAEHRAVARFDHVDHEDILDVVDTLQNGSRHARILPEQVIDGVSALGLAYGDEPDKRVAWVDVRSHKLIRWEATSRDEGNQVSRYVIAGFSYDAPLDPDLFDLTPPAGYRVEQQGAIALQPPAPEGLQSPTLSLRQGIGPAHFGMPLEEVIRVFGAPEDRDEKLQSYRYPSRGIELLIAPDRGLWGVFCRTQEVAQNRLRGYSGRTDAGIGMGANSAEIIAAYGPPDERAVSETGETLSYRELHVHFSLHRRALVFIQHEWTQAPVKKEVLP